VSVKSGQNPKLPFAAEGFDVIFSACVFHHIPISLRPFWIDELHRVLKPNGLLMIYEHNPLNPITQYVFRTAEFDVGAHMISSTSLSKLLRRSKFSHVNSKFRAFFPRWLRIFLKLEPYLTKIPIGAQYYTVGTKL
jgi:SAM-dependent methyltransferase